MPDTLQLTPRIYRIRSFGGNGFASCSRQSISVDKAKKTIFRIKLAVDPTPHSYSGLTFRMKGPVDISEHTVLAFRVRGYNGNEVFELKLRDSFGQNAHESMIISRNFLDIEREWTQCYIPLSLFGTVDKQHITHLVVAANSSYSPTVQMLDIADIECKSVPLDSIESKRPEIFVAHGHDKTMKEEVARTLMKLKLKPIILREQPGGGKTIIENFINYANVGFAVVLVSPDDKGYAKNAPKSVKLRARQNVIFELGFFVGKLGRERVMILYRTAPNFEIPTDYAGVIGVPFDQNNWEIELIKELQRSGYRVDANDLVRQRF